MKIMNSKKPVTTVLFEAIIVGVLLVILYKIIESIVVNLLKIKSNLKYLFILFLSGFIFHVICEYLGVNMWYSKNYCKLL